MCHPSFLTVNNISQTAAQTARHLLLLLSSINMSSGAGCGCHYKLQRSSALAILALGSICWLVEQKLEPCHEHPAGHLHSFDVWGLGSGGWGLVLSTGAHQHRKGHIRMCGYILFWNCLPLVHSVAVTQGALAVCRISLAQTEESFVFFVLGSWESNFWALWMPCLVKLFLFSWVCGPCQYSMLTLQCVGASACSLEGLGTEVSQAHVHHGNSI